MKSQSLLKYILISSLGYFILNSCSKGSLSSGSSNDSIAFSGTWVNRAILKDGRGYAVSFTIGDSVAYVGSGFDGFDTDSLLNDFYKYNINVGIWTQVSSLIVNAVPVNRRMAVAFSVNGKGYVGSGLDYHLNFHNDFYCYDPATDTWKKIADLPGAPRARATAFGLDNVQKGYVIGGCGNNNTYFSDVYTYNPASDSWTQGQDLPYDRRAGASSFVLDDKGYVVGGFDGNRLSPYFYQYDPSKTNHWTTQRQITAATDSSFDDTWTMIERVDGVAMVIGGKVYYMTGAITPGSTFGQGIGSPNITTWRWDPDNDTWSRSTNYPLVGRWGSVGFSLQGRGFVGTGLYGKDTTEYQLTPTGDSLPLHTNLVANYGFDEFVPNN